MKNFFLFAFRPKFSSSEFRFEELLLVDDEGETAEYVGGKFE